MEEGCGAARTRGACARSKTMRPASSPPEIRPLADGAVAIMLQVLGLYRGGRTSERQAAFLDDLAPSLDDLAIDARP